MNFNGFHARYKRLRRKVEAGRITVNEFSDRLERITFVDVDGLTWKHGSEGDLMYYFDGEDWRPGELLQSGMEPHAQGNGDRAGSGGWATFILLSILGWAMGVVWGALLGRYASWPVYRLIGGALSGVIAWQVLKEFAPGTPRWRVVLLVTSWVLGWMGD